MSQDITPHAPRPELADHILPAIYAHARETYPEECCGLLLGPSGTATIDEVRRCVNDQNRLHDLDPERHRSARQAYTFNREDESFLDQSFGSPRPVKIIYHSHPDVGAYFSATDTAAALNPFEPDDPEPLYPVGYIVIDAQSNHIAGAKLFCWNAVEKDFVETAAYDGNQSSVD